MHHDGEPASHCLELGFSFWRIGIGVVEAPCDFTLFTFSPVVAGKQQLGRAGGPGRWGAALNHALTAELPHVRWGFVPGQSWGDAGSFLWRCFPSQIFHVLQVSSSPAPMGGDQGGAGGCAVTTRLNRALNWGTPCPNWGCFSAAYPAQSRVAAQLPPLTLFETMLNADGVWGVRIKPVPGARIGPFPVPRGFRGQSVWNEPEQRRRNAGFNSGYPSTAMGSTGCCLLSFSQHWEPPGSFWCELWCVGRCQLLREGK